MRAAERDAYNQGAQHKRGGIALDRTMMNFHTDATEAFANYGWRTQQAHPGEKVDSSFFLEHAHCKVCAANMAKPKENIKMRTAEQLASLEAAYREEVYDSYAKEQTDGGFTPQPFDEAFAAHLEALDADAGIKPEDNETVGAKPAKPAKAPKAKKFRPTSEDRAAIMAAAKKLTKDGVPRMKLADGSPYVDFLKGMTMALDGSLEVVLNVFTAADARKEAAAAVGQLKVTVKKGEFVKATKA